MQPCHVTKLSENAGKVSIYTVPGRPGSACFEFADIHVCTYSDRNLLQLPLYVAVDDFYMNIYNLIQYK